DPRHLLLPAPRREVLDGLRHAVLDEDEVLLLQIGDEVPVAVRHRHAEGDQIHAGAEGHLPRGDRGGHGQGQHGRDKTDAGHVAKMVAPDTRRGSPYNVHLCVVSRSVTRSWSPGSWRQSWCLTRTSKSWSKARPLRGAWKTWTSPSPL